MKVQDVANQIKAAKSQKPKLRKTTTVALCHYWLETIAFECEKTPKPLTGKEIGQLKQLLKFCPNEHLEGMIPFVVCDWVGFTAKAKADHALKEVPVAHDIGFLLKYVDSALNFFLASKQPKVPVGVILNSPSKTLKEKPVQLIAPTEDDDKPMTPEDYNAIIGGKG